MKQLWKTSKLSIVLSLLAAVVILAADIGSRPYIAVGGGVVMVVPGVVTYWIYRLVEGESHEQRTFKEYDCE